MTFHEKEKTTSGGLEVSVNGKTFNLLEGARKKIGASHVRVLYTDGEREYAFIPADEDNGSAYAVGDDGQVSAAWTAIPDDVNRKRVKIEETTINGETAYVFENPHAEAIDDG